MNAQVSERAIRGFSFTVVVALLVLLSRSAPQPPWQVYVFAGDAFVSLLHLSPSSLTWSSSPGPFDSPCPSVPDTWRVTACTLADVTHDGAPEWVLLVWRPWRDWPIQRWSSVPSPIADFHDAAGQSCHLILRDPQSGREVWAGSALPAPLLALAVGDVDGNGRNEVVALEGDYVVGRDGPARHINVWRWNGFGFTLEWRSPPATFRQLCLTDVNNDGILDVAVR